MVGWGWPIYAPNTRTNEKERRQLPPPPLLQKKKISSQNVNGWNRSQAEMFVASSPTLILPPSKKIRKENCVQLCSPYGVSSFSTTRAMTSRPPSSPLLATAWNTESEQRPHIQNRANASAFGSLLKGGSNYTRTHAKNVASLFVILIFYHKQLRRF